MTSITPAEMISVGGGLYQLKQIKVNSVSWENHKNKPLTVVFTGKCALLLSVTFTLIKDVYLDKETTLSKKKRQSGVLLSRETIQLSAS